MPKCKFEMTIESPSEVEATKKMQALTVLAGKLSEKELTKLAHIVKHDPVKTALAKKYLGV
jgi:hypothetical protein